jgi:hypothetical protein
MRKPRILLADEHELVLAGRVLFWNHTMISSPLRTTVCQPSQRATHRPCHTPSGIEPNKLRPRTSFWKVPRKKVRLSEIIKVLSGRSLWRTISQVRRNLVQDFLAVVLDDPRFVLGESSIRPYVKQQPLAPTGEGTKCFGLLHNYPPVIT